MTLKTADRTRARPPMNEALRRHHHGPLQPMEAAPGGDIFETLFGKLLEKVRGS